MKNIKKIIIASALILTLHSSSVFAWEIYRPEVDIEQNAIIEMLEEDVALMKAEVEAIRKENQDLREEIKVIRETATSFRDQVSKMQRTIVGLLLAFLRK